MKTADKLYAMDTNPDDPNRAFKGTWPSTELWRRCIGIAEKIFPSEAEEIIAGIPDAEIAAIEKVALASALLAGSAGSGFVSECRKSGSSSTFSY